MQSKTHFLKSHILLLSLIEGSNALLREQNKPLICLRPEDAYGTVKVSRSPGFQGFSVALRFPTKCERIQSIEEVNSEIEEVEVILEGTNEAVDALETSFNKIND